MTHTQSLADVGRLPAPGDNVAIAVRRLEAGTAVSHPQTAVQTSPSSEQPFGHTFTLSHTLLEGHRFAIAPIAPGDNLLSWGLPFGVAIAPIAPGDYVANADMLEALNGRFLDFPIPATPNFRNNIQPYLLNESQFQPSEQVSLYDEPRHFMGYWRSQRRGVGTRNMVVILGTSSRSGSYAQLLAERLEGLADGYDNIDGIAAISHTEGDGDDPINNWDFVLRTLAGLVVHPNVGAVLIVDGGGEQVNNRVLRDFMNRHDYPLDEVVHRFVTLTGHLAADLAGGTAVIKSWLPTVNQTSRTPQPLSALNIALQCGGSDAFSGVSGNPLAGAVAREIIRYGGNASIAETDELIGAEPYMLQKVRDWPTAQRFLHFIEQFKERVSWHGSSAEGNPSGGNRYRGLYNIALKSIGAAMKKAPDLRLDYAIDYAEPMRHPGFYFMNTPGNDLESIAGQVAGGANVIFFVTGNGSITNFPFVPTIKLVTTTLRFERLAREMDVNAGAYQDGRSMESLCAETLDLTVAIASGQLSLGEKAGHAQISLWRNWRQTDGSQTAVLLNATPPDGQPLPAKSHDLLPGNWEWTAVRTPHGPATDQVGLILPTSLCSGQIARLGAEHLNQQADKHGLSRFVTLVHTEGCGVAMPTVRDLYNETMVSYMTHPLVGHGLFLEHGCEKTHNDYMRHQLMERGRDPEQFGWASVQADGGIGASIAHMRHWFAGRETAVSTTEQAGLNALRLGVLAQGDVPDTVAQSLAQLVRTVVTAGGTVVLPQRNSLLDGSFWSQVSEVEAKATVAYGQTAVSSCLHLMDTPSRHWTETLTGLAATGIEIIIAYQAKRPQAAHPLVPVLQITLTQPSQQADFDLVFTDDPDQWTTQLMRLVLDAASRRYTPRLAAQKLVDFQLTRGLLGIST
ncbi:MAG: UxaA family hydrolase [Anaerolineales bacterium]|nr:UxaA family hydrolase [Anaerolineales bacterium]